MKIFETVTIMRLENGLYKIQMAKDEPIYVGNAATTIIALSHLVFAEESRGNFKFLEGK